MNFPPAKSQVPNDEIEFMPIRAGGPGGQNVNKVSSAIHLRFDIKRSSLPAAVKQRLLGLRDRRISKDGIVIIKAQQYRTQEKNRLDAIARLNELVQLASRQDKKRIPTRPGKAAKKRRMDDKVHRGRLKQLRAKINE